MDLLWYEAEFRFYEELNDFLVPARRKVAFVYRFHGTPSLKDAIESLGVPHTEVDLVLVNGRSVGFAHRLQHHDRVAVYPVFEAFDIGPVTRLRPAPLRVPRFVCDVHLGKLARRLRLLGFDTAYDRDADDPAIVAQSVADHRIILTRDRGLLMHRAVTHGACLHATAADDQVREVVARFDLRSQFRPSTRCSLCNGLLEPVPKEAVADRLLPGTAAHGRDFQRCRACGRLFWRGSHAAKLDAWLAALSTA